MKQQPEYKQLFTRNIGVVTEAEQEKLRSSRVAIPGLGGVGGTFAMTLARLGIGRFHISDFDVFEPANFNRQAGATLQTLGRPKTEVMKEMILSINPEAEIRVFEKGLKPENLDAFLDGVDLVVDGLDAFALGARRLLFPACEQKGIHAITSGPFGMTATLHVFGPGAMPFEEYFDFAHCVTSEDEMVAFLAGVAPAGLHFGQVDFRYVSLEEKFAPSVGMAIQLCAGVVGVTALKALLGRKPLYLAPGYFQFDPNGLRMKKGRLVFGNRGPIQRIRRALLKRGLAEAAARAKSARQQSVVSS